jgi:hypothetical protein
MKVPMNLHPSPPSFPVSDEARVREKREILSLE